MSDVTAATHRGQIKPRSSDAPFAQCYDIVKVNPEYNITTLSFRGAVHRFAAFRSIPESNSRTYSALKAAVRHPWR